MIVMWQVRLRMRVARPRPGAPALERGALVRVGGGDEELLGGMSLLFAALATAESSTLMMTSAAPRRTAGWSGPRPRTCPDQVEHDPALVADIRAWRCWARTPGRSLVLGPVIADPRASPARRGTEGPGGSELAELVADHRLGHVHRHVCARRGRRSVADHLGMIVERRDQVLITFFWPFSLRSSTFLSRWSSTKGPFFRLRGISDLPLSPARSAPGDGARAASGTACSVAGAALGLAPGRHRVTTTRGLALATTVRWSTGFMATPRVCGRTPFQRLQPALPILTRSCSGCRPRRRWPGSRSGRGASRSRETQGGVVALLGRAARSSRPGRPSCRRRQLELDVVQ